MGQVRTVCRWVELNGAGEKGVSVGRVGRCEW